MVDPLLMSTSATPVDAADILFAAGAVSFASETSHHTPNNAVADTVDLRNVRQRLDLAGRSQTVWSRILKNLE